MTSSSIAKSVSFVSLVAFACGDPPVDHASTAPASVASTTPASAAPIAIASALASSGPSVATSASLPTTASAAPVSPGSLFDGPSSSQGARSKHARLSAIMPDWQDQGSTQDGTLWRRAKDGGAGISIRVQTQRPKDLDFDAVDCEQAAFAATARIGFKQIDWAPAEAATFGDTHLPGTVAQGSAPLGKKEWVVYCVRVAVAPDRVARGAVAYRTEQEALYRAALNDFLKSFRVEE